MVALIKKWKTKKKTNEQPSVREGSPMDGWGIWLEGFLEDESKAKTKRTKTKFS